MQNTACPLNFIRFIVNKPEIYCNSVEEQIKQHHKRLFLC